jgi:UDPglucose 6-dehydrogenase
LLTAIYASNQAHKEWPRRKLRQLLGDLEGKTIAILGLTYKPGTDTLRRSMAIELCRWLAAQGSAAKAYDPAVRQAPRDLTDVVTACASVREALDGADAAVVMTEWPEFKSISPGDLQAMRKQVILDPNRFLDASLREVGDLVYAAVGYRGEGR